MTVRRLRLILIRHGETELNRTGRIQGLNSDLLNKSSRLQARAVAEIIAVEPAGYDDTGRSLAAGRRLANRPGGRSMCDALLVPRPGALTFPLNRHLLSGAVVVADEAVARAMVASFLHLKLVTEPSGAIALAACLSGAAKYRDKTVVVVASGGNVDPSLFRQVLRSHAP